eukprot:5238099-Amphidinium_carterae.1
MDLAGEWTQVGPGGSHKRRAQSPLLDSQRATMYRALSPSAATEDVNMGIATPRGTGGLSPPPAAPGTRQDRPPGASLLEQASLGAGVEIAEEPRTVENSVALGGGAAAHDTARGRQPEPRPVRT